ncbi:hypothetical protein M3223_14005 [Paenibacillus pasadenensis]|uniref:hypothetical protein n=1 Tax=Paenibacillus pasadenensis TaxID=217090 RepID=UPI00203AD73B|nr:hypothetical protein [Paenibacillus pasadenensis]MCM3748461.1 hypothetical protein [Paenibacillus pasadenensis]
MEKVKVSNCGCGGYQPRKYCNGNGGGNGPGINEFPNYTVVLVNPNGTLSRTPNFIARLYRGTVVVAAVRLEENGIAVFPNVPNPSQESLRAVVVGGVSGTVYGTTIIPRNSLGGIVLNTRA